MSELVRKLSGTPPQPAFPKGAVDTQMHMYLPGYPALPGGPGLPPGALPGPEDYRQLMQWLGIDRVIITRGNAQQRDNGNTLACVAEMGEAARAVVIIDEKTTEKDMERLAAAGAVGARIMDLRRRGEPIGTGSGGSACPCGRLDGGGSVRRQWASRSFAAP